jgi:hypothetical protein
VKECVGVWVKARSAFQLFSFSLQHPLRAAGQWNKANGVSAKHLSVFSISAFQLFSSAPFSFQHFSFQLFSSAPFSFQHFSFSAFQLFRTLPLTPSQKQGQKNILIIYHFPLANFVSAGVIYPHRKKVGFGPGGLNPRKSKVLTGWTEWE